MTDGHRLEGAETYVGPFQEISDTIFAVRDPKREYVIQGWLGTAGGIKVKVMAWRCTYYKGEIMRYSLQTYFVYSQGRHAAVADVIRPACRNAKSFQRLVNDLAISTVTLLPIGASWAFHSPLPRIRSFNGRPLV